MDTPIAKSSTSLPTGENDARSEEQPKVSADVLMAALENQHRGILKIFRTSIGINVAGVGTVTALAEVLRDLGAVKRFGIPDLGWMAALQNLQSAINSQANMDIARDRLVSKTLPVGTLSAFILAPSDKYSPELRDKLRALRGVIVLHHLALHQTPGRAMCDVIASLFRANEQNFWSIAKRIDLNKECLIVLRGDLSLNSRVAKLLTTVISAIDGPVARPPVLDAGKNLRLVTCFENIKADEDKHTDDKGQTVHESNIVGAQAGDLLNYLMSQVAFQRPRAFSGIFDLFEYVQPHELELYVPVFADDLHTPRQAEALAALLTFLTHCRPNRMALIPLTAADGQPIWLDVSAGHLCWLLEAITDSRYFDPGRSNDLLLEPQTVRIPLPIEVADALSRLQQQHQNAKTVGDLLGINLQKLDSDTKKYVRSISKTSHRATLSRLESSFGRYLLNQCHDETYASAIGLDFALGTTANLNYVVLLAEKINAILRKAYIALGFKGDIQQHPKADIGSEFGARESDVADMLVSSLQAVNSAYLNLPRHVSDERLFATHNIIAKGILLPLAVVTGHRAADQYSFATHTLDCERRLALICDKRVSPYQWGRIVPIPSIINSWINFYYEWLGSLRYRLNSIDRAIAADVESVMQSIDKRATGSLFFCFENGVAQPMGSAHIAKIFSSFNFPTNIGRHWGDWVLRAHDVDSAVIMAWHGHAGTGQESYGSRSALDPMTVMKAVDTVFDQTLQKLNLPVPQKLSARACKVTFSSKNSFVPALFQKDVESPELVGAEPCPFYEYTLAHARKFTTLICQWLRSAPKNCMGEIAASLIFLDGVVHRQELLDGVKQLCFGKIYQCDQNYFVDTNTAALGIRRIWLNPTTVRLAMCFEPDNLTEADVEAATSSTFPELGDGPETYENVLMFALGFYSTMLPGSLRAWVAGLTHARTLRQEAVARHQYNFIEHPTFNSGIRVRGGSRTLKSDQFIKDAIKKYCNRNRHIGTNETRLRHLAEELITYRSQPLGSLETEVLLSFTLYLARKVGAPATVLRYYSAINPLVRLTTKMVDCQEELAALDWPEEARNFLEQCPDREDPDSPTVSALNHFLAFVGVDFRTYRPKDPAAAARRYGDYPSQQEIQRAIELSRAIEDLPSPRRDQPAFCIEIMAQHPMRSCEIARLRIADINSAAFYPDIVITPEATGSVKTLNAKRVLRLSENETAASLRALEYLRRTQFPEQPEAFLLGNAEDKTSNADASPVLEVASQALQHVTGSGQISLYTLRHAVLTRKSHGALAPGQANVPLIRRQLLYSIAAQAGHGDFQTTFENYVFGMENLRRQWADCMLDDCDVGVSPRFLSALTGVSEATYRKRMSRGAAPLNTTDALEGHETDKCSHFIKRVVDLESYVVRGATKLSSEYNANPQDTCYSAAAYTAQILLGVEPDVAAYTSQIDRGLQKTIDRGIQLIRKAFGHSWSVRSQIQANTFVCCDLFKQAALRIGSIVLSADDALQLCSFVQPHVDISWAIPNVDAVRSLSTLLPVLTSLGIEPDVKIKRSGKKAISFEERLAIKSAGFSRMRAISARHFPSDTPLLVGFVPQTITDGGRSRIMPNTIFLITSNIIATCATKLGGINHGN